MSDLERAARFAYGTLANIKNPPTSVADTFICVAKALNWEHGYSERAEEEAMKRCKAVVPDK